MILKYIASIPILFFGVLLVIDQTAVLGCSDLGDTLTIISYYGAISAVLVAYFINLWIRHSMRKTVKPYDFAPLMVAMIVLMSIVFVKNLVTIRGGELMVATDLRDVWSAKLRLRTGGSVIAESVEVDRFCRHEGTYHWMGDTLLLDDGLVISGEGFFANMYLMDSAQKFLVPIGDLAAGRRIPTSLSIASRAFSSNK